MEHNTQAKYLLEDVDFSDEGAHLAMTLNGFGGSASQKRDHEGAYLYKSNKDDLTEEQKSKLDLLEKSEQVIEVIGKSETNSVNSLNKDSDGLSSESISNNPSDDNINKTKGKEMSDKPEQTTENISLEDLQKSVLEMQELLKAEKEARAEAEAKALEIEKAAEAERIQKAKDELTEVVKAWNLESQDEVVDALFKAEASDILIKEMENMHQRVEKAKQEFAESEQGADGEIVDAPAEVHKASVKEILEKRKAAKASK